MLILEGTAGLFTLTGPWKIRAAQPAEIEQAPAPPGTGLKELRVEEPLVTTGLTSQPRIFALVPTQP